MSACDNKHMALALKLAQRGLYTTDPNPRVGCVLVKQGRVIAEGWHERAGEPHAEIMALNAVGTEEAKGATAYVTLEPCSHHGRTPPCADALVVAGIKRVVVAMQDPNPKVSGNGLDVLRRAGMQVVTDLMKAQAEALNPGFIKRMREGKPWVRVKLAASLDGRTAMASGESNWITGPAARRDVQFLRARSSAILTGSGTVLRDQPSLNVRLTAAELGVSGAVRQPVRVVLDSLLRVPHDAKLFQLEGASLIYTSANKNRNNNNINNKITVISGFSDGAKINLSKMLDDLADRQINELHVEAGATLCGALLKQGLIDELVLYTATHVMGDAGKPLFHLPELQQMKNKVSFSLMDVRQLGQDIRLTLRPNS